MTCFEPLSCLDVVGCGVMNMTGSNKHRFDVMTSMGIEFKGLRFSKLKALVEDGTLRPDDQVIVHGYESQGQVPLARIKGLSFPEKPYMQQVSVTQGWAPVTGSSHENDSPSGEASAHPLLRRSGLMILGFAACIGMIVLCWSFLLDSEDAAPSAHLIPTDHFQSHKAFMGLQSELASQLHNGITLWDQSLGQVDEEIQLNWQLYLDSNDSKDTRAQLRAMLSPAFVDAAEDFQESYLSNSANQALQSLAHRNAISQRDALLDWLIAEPLVDHGLTFEIWRHEYDLTEDAALVRRIGLMGSANQPELKDGVQYLGDTGSSFSYRVFGGSFELSLRVDPARVSTLPDITPRNGRGSVPVVFEGDLLLLRNNAYGIEPGDPLEMDQLEVDFIYEDGRWRGFWENQIQAYINCLEVTPWGQQHLATGQIAKTDLIADAIFQTEGGELDQDDWVEHYGRSIPLISEGGASGTGFLVEESDRLYLVTNRHVIDGSSAPEDYKPPMKSIRVWHLTVDGLSKITSKYAYVLAPSEFKVHANGIDLAVADVTSRREDFDSRSIFPLPMTRIEVGRGEELFWVGHPSSIADGDSSGVSSEENGFWERNLDLLKLTEGNLNLSKEYSGRQMEHWKQGVTNMLFVDTPIVAGNSGGPMLSAETQRVVGVCSMGLLISQGSKHGAIRAEHVYETIDRGVLWDPVSMGPGEPMLASSLSTRFGLGEDFSDSQGVVRLDDGTVFQIEYAESFQPLSPGLKYSWEISEVVSAGLVKRNTELLIMAFPDDQSVDLDINLVDSSGSVVARDIRAPDELFCASVKANARVFTSLNVINASEDGSSSVLLIVLSRK